jgi:hypothetical protein
MIGQGPTRPAAPLVCRGPCGDRMVGAPCQLGGSVAVLSLLHPTSLGFNTCSFRGWKLFAMTPDER